MVKNVGHHLYESSQSYLTYCPPISPLTLHTPRMVTPNSSVTILVDSDYFTVFKQSIFQT